MSLLYAYKASVALSPSSLRPWPLTPSSLTHPSLQGLVYAQNVEASAPEPVSSGPPAYSSVVEGKFVNPILASGPPVPGLDDDSHGDRKGSIRLPVPPAGTSRRWSTGDQEMDEEITRPLENDPVLPVNGPFHGAEMVAQVSSESLVGVWDLSACRSGIPL